MDTKEAHYCYKGFHSFHLHTIVDHLYIVYDAHVGWPGASGDSTIWQARPFHKDLRNGSADECLAFLPPHHYIVGDGGYALNNFVVTPYGAPACDSGPKAVFNWIQSKTRRIVEQVL